MPRCNPSCTIRYDSRSKEQYCYNHGTVVFSSQPCDPPETLWNSNPYSDRFIYNAVMFGTLRNCFAVSKELNLPPQLVENAVDRYVKVLSVKSSAA